MKGGSRDQNEPSVSGPSRVFLSERPPEHLSEVPLRCNGDLEPASLTSARARFYEDREQQMVTVSTNKSLSPELEISAFELFFLMVSGRLSGKADS